MSHSQFHCTARVYLDMHGLIFETSICYWQDQPGSRATGHDPTGPARRRPLSLLPSLSLACSLGFPVWPLPGRRRRPPGRTPLGGAGGPPSFPRSLARSPTTTERRARSPGRPRRPPPRGEGAGTAAQLLSAARSGPPRGSRTRARAARPAGADPPSGTGGEADGETKPRRRRRTC